MEINIKHTDTFDSGAFILNKNRLPYFPYKELSSIFLTQEENNSLKIEILNLIAKSKEVLKICSFILTDKQVYDALLNKVQTSDTAIFILTQLDQSKLLNSLSLLDVLTDEELKENSTQTHLRFIKTLYENGVHVRASLSAHAKFILSDRKIGFITSANLTTPSLTFNTESGVYVDEKGTLELDQLFDVIFQRGTGYRQFISSTKKQKMFIVQAEVKIDKNLLPNPFNSNLRYTYENETNNLFEEIIKIIDEAVEYLYISTYSIVGLALINEFTQAIKNANNRGVKLNLFCRGMNYKSDHLNSAGILHSIGCEIFGDIFNHSKGIINEKTGMIFTANIDGNHGLINGFEVGNILTETQRSEFLKILKYLIETSFYTFNLQPTRIELFHTYQKYEIFKGIKSPIFSEDIIIEIKKNMNINIEELSRLPLFYGKTKEIEYIIAGNSFFKCNSTENTFVILEREKPRFDLEKYLLKYSNLKIIEK